MPSRLFERFLRRTGSTPMRLALGLVAIFAAVNLLTLGVAYLSLKAATERTIRANLAQHLAGFGIPASARAIEVLVAAEADAADPSDRVFAYIAPDGRVTGNADAVLTGTGVEIHPAPDGRPLSKDGYLPAVKDVAGGILIVAESRRPLRELGRTFLGLLVLSVAPTVLISLATGAAIGARTRRRVDAIERTLTRLGEGELGARIPPEPRREDDLARIGARINRMAAAQEASTDALRQVSTDIAHDLKTPLQRMTVLLREVRGLLPDGSDGAALADRALAEADGAVGVFNGLLQIAQIEGGAARRDFVAVDLARVAADLAELFGPVAEETGHHLTIDRGPGQAIVPGNRDLLGQALANLIENALRHTPPGTEIALRTRTTGDGTVLEVADTGPGIPAAEHAAVLRRLYRLERSRTTPGNGLGLSLVAATAALHGARLALLDNDPGLIVRLTFPSEAATVRTGT